MDLLLNAAGDLDVENGDITLATGIAAIRQRILIKLRTFRGEWFLDERIGVPYFQEILGGKFRPSLLEAIFRDEILSVPGVLSVSAIEFDFNRSTRELTFDFRAQVEEGEVEVSAALVQPVLVIADIADVELEPDEAFSYTPTIANVSGLTPLVWSSVGTTLPAWLSLNTSTGALTGTPGFGDVETVSGLQLQVACGSVSAVSNEFEIEVSIDHVQQVFDSSDTESYPGTGTSWFDLIDNSRVMTLSSASFNAGVAGGVFTFTNGGGSTPSYAGVNTNAFSLEMWVKIASGQGNFKALAGKFFNSSFGSWAINTADFNNQSVRFYTYDGSSFYPVTVPGVMTNAWVHLVCTTGASANKAYVNAGAPVSAVKSGAVTYNGGNVEIGNFNGGFYLQMTTGLVKLHAKELSALEVSNLFEASRARFGV